MLVWYKQGLSLKSPYVRLCLSICSSSSFYWTLLKHYHLNSINKRNLHEILIVLVLFNQFLARTTLVTWLPNQVVAIYMIAVPDRSNWSPTVYKVAPFTQVTDEFKLWTLFLIEVLSSCQTRVEYYSYGLGVCKFDAGDQPSDIRFCTGRFAEDGKSVILKGLEKVCHDGARLENK